MKLDLIEGLKAASVATVVIAIITAVLAGLLYWQTSELTTQTEILQREFSVSHRPWIGVSKLNVTNNQILYHYSNYGSIPNLSGESKAISSNDEITRDELEEIEPTSMTVLLPTQEIVHRMSDDINQHLLDSRLEGKDFYLEFCLNMNTKVIGVECMELSKN